MPLVITLDSEKYVAKDNVRRDGSIVPLFTSAPIRPFVDAIETSGRPDSASVRDRISLDFPNLFDGFGRDRIDSDSARVPAEYRRCHYSTCDIRFAHGIRLPILEEDSTETGLEVIRASAAFKGNLWGLWESTTSSSMRSRKYVGSTTTWTAGGNVNSQPKVDATSSGSVASDTSLTVSHTVTTDPNAILVVGALCENDEPTGITYNSVAMTKLVTADNGATNVSLWYLVAPATGANNIVVTKGGGVGHIGIGGLSFSNVDQSTPLSNDTSTTGTGNNTSLNVTTVNDAMAVDVVGNGANEAATPGSGQTEYFDVTPGNGGAGIYERATGTTTTMSQSWSTSTSFAHVAARVNGVTQVGLDMKAHKTHLLTLLAVADSHVVRRSTDGVTFAAASTQPTAGLLANNVTANEDIDAGFIETVGNEAVLTIWDEDSGTVTFFSSTNAGDTWTDETIDIASGNGPQGVAVMNGIDNAQKLYVGTREGLYEVDTAPSTWTADLIFPMIPNNDNCRRMAVGQDGALWFAQGVGDDSVPIVYRMFTNNGTREFEPVPNDFSLGDGLPAEQLGPIRWMQPVQGMMYVSAGGGKSGRKASIWVHNTRGWSSMRAHGTENQKIEWIAASGDDDGTPRLHYAIRTASSTSNTKFLAQPFVNPNTGVTIKRESTGLILYPYVDAGFPLDQGPWLQASVNAEDLSTTNSDEYISAKYGTGDAGALEARTANTLGGGDFLSGTRRLDLVSGTGVLATTFGVELILHRGSTNTKTPILKDFSIAVIKEPPERERWEITIDIDATMELTGRTAENIISDFETTRGPGLLRDFTYGPVTTARKVKVDAAPWRPAVTEQASTPSAVVAGADIQRAGEIDLVLTERI